MKWFVFCFECYLDECQVIQVCVYSDLNLSSKDSSYVACDAVSMEKWG